MTDQRLYRLAFAPAIVAIVVLLFSLQPVPEPLSAPLTLDRFDQTSAELTAEEIVRTAPERTPGSEGDSAIADMVAKRFTAIPSAEVSEQRVSSSFDGDDVELRNVIATLPGQSDGRIVMLAPRDAATGPGAASSAAATAVLLDIAERFGDAAHRKTLVFVSTTGGTDGATGAREFAEAHPERDLIEAALVVSQPGALEPEPPFVIPWSTGRQSTAIQLTETAADIVSAEIGRPVGLEGSLGELMRLALPTGLGEQAPLIEHGLDAVAISSDGERPIAAIEDGSDSLSSDTVAEFGQAAQTIVLALDSNPGPPEHGPGTYINFAGNLIPGWSLALVTIALLLPAAVAAADGWARAIRRDWGRPRDLGWVLGRVLPLIGVLLLAWVMSLVGLLPSPRFPYDPARFGLGWRAAIVSLLLAVALFAALTAARPLRVPRGATPEGLAPAIGVVMSSAAVAMWLLNPFLAFGAIPAAHAWLAGTIEDPRRRFAATLAAIGIALVPVVVGLTWIASRLEVGIAAPWHALLMLAGGQLGPGQALLGCLFAGSLLAMLAVALAPPAPELEPRISVERNPDLPGTRDGVDGSPMASG